jgi:hypothetical protein
MPSMIGQGLMSNASGDHFYVPFDPFPAVGDCMDAIFHAIVCHCIGWKLA